MNRRIERDAGAGGVGSPAAVYGLTLALVAAAGLLRWSLDPFLGDRLPFPTFYAAVAAASWLGGLRPALFAAGLGSAAALYFFVPPRQSFALPSGPHSFELAVYSLVCLAFAGFGGAMHADRRRAGRERAEAFAERERFRLAAEAVNGIIYEFDLETGRVERQRGLYEVVGYRADEAPPTAAWWREQIHPDDLEACERQFAEATGDSVVGEYRVRHKDGRWRHVIDRALLIRRADGRPMKMVGCTVDTTAQNEAEAELRRRETFTGGILGSITDGLLVLDAGWRIAFANDEIVRRFGKGRGIVGGILWEIFPDAVGKEAHVSMHRAVADRTAVEYEVFYEPWQKWFLDKAFPTADGGLTVYSRDITEQKETEAELRRRETFTGGILGSITDGFLVVDGTWWITFANDEIVRRFGKERAEIVGGYLWDMFPAVVGNEAYASMHRAMAERVPVEYEILYDPWQQWFLNKAFPTADGGLAVYSRDITEQKRGEEERRQSEARLRRVFESNVVGMIRWDLDRSLILDANAEFLRMTGYTRDDVAGGRLNFRDLTPAEWTARNEQGIRAIRADGQTAPYEKEYFRRDGSRVPLLIAGMRFEDSPSEGMSFLIDLSETKRAEAELRTSEERLRLIVDSATGFAIFTMDTDGIIDGWNAGAERLFGYPEAEVVGRHDRILYTPDDAAEKIPEREMRKAAADGRAVNERWHARKDGSRFWGSGLVQPLRDDGGIIGFLKIMQDMTEARLAEERLRQSEERRRLALDAAELGMWHVEPATRATKTDARYRVIFGTTEDWTDYLQAVAVIHPDDQPAVLEAVATATRLKNPSPFAIEYRIVHPDGSLRWVLANGRPSFEGAGPTRRVVSFDGTVADITDRKRSEGERERLVGQLREADRRKDEFLATLAHELRNPLAPIRNGLQVMKMAGGDPGAVEKARRMMERQVGQMTHLIDDLMDLARISGGKIVLQKARLKVADVVREALDTSRPLIEERGHELVVDVPPEPIHVDGDRTRLTQVFGNLLNNAAKYTDTGGRIRVAVERRGGDVVVAVEDNGVGILAHSLTRVFDMFAQVDRSLEKSQGGLGIGLNIVKRLVEMHGGGIVAESGGHGAGSRFAVSLPMASALTTDEPDDRPDTAKAEPARRRILIVDDNEDGAASLAMMLEIMGNETLTASDGLEAVAAAEAFGPDVILMDIGMPRLNGYEACRRIRGESWGRDIVIVAQTGWGQDDDRRKSREAGFTLHMVKPIDPAALQKMLAEWKATNG